MLHIPWKPQRVCHWLWIWFPTCKERMYHQLLLFRKWWKGKSIFILQSHLSPETGGGLQQNLISSLTQLLAIWSSLKASRHGVAISQPQFQSKLSLGSGQCCPPMFQQKLGEQLFIQQGSLHPLTQDMMRMTLLPKKHVISTAFQSGIHQLHQSPSQSQSQPQPRFVSLILQWWFRFFFRITHSLHDWGWIGKIQCSQIEANLQGLQHQKEVSTVSVNQFLWCCRKQEEWIHLKRLLIEST
jgi:hypothetical protein